MKPSFGTYQEQPKGFRAFVPFSFPPKQGIVLSPALEKKHSEAMLQVGRLDGIAKLLPDKDFFLLMFIRKDASSSSQIEGTQATMMDAIEAESKERPHGLPPDVDDILHYIKALNYGLKRTDTLPLSLRLVKELHKILMTQARSTHRAFPGEFRNSQNWIGGTTPVNARFVPPPVENMKAALNDFEKFIHANDDYLPLIKAGLIHSQFETIHPFIDGNGRTGRMLITMYMWNIKLLELPVLYLSNYFKQNQKVYYERLNGYHSEPSQVEKWLDFFLDGIIDTAKSAIKTCEKITELRERDMGKAHKLGKPAAEITVEILRNLYRQPNVGIADIVSWTKYTRQGAHKALNRLVGLSILKPMSPKVRYAQRYIYADYYDLFREQE